MSQSSESTSSSQPIPAKQYLLINALVWLYSIGMLVAAKALVGDVTGLGFVSVALPVGFALVSAFDFIYDRLKEPPPQKKE